MKRAIGTVMLAVPISADVIVRTLGDKQGKFPPGVDKNGGICLTIG